MQRICHTDRGDTRQWTRIPHRIPIVYLDGETSKLLLELVVVPLKRRLEVVLRRH